MSGSVIHSQSAVMVPTVYSAGQPASLPVAIGLRIFLSAGAFEELVSELTMKCQEDILAKALTGLRCLYGDL